MFVDGLCFGVFRFCGFVRLFVVLSGTCDLLVLSFLDLFLLGGLAR